MRKIEIEAASKDVIAACEEEAGPAELNYAIGRLAMWAIAGDSDRYSGKCRIWIEHSKSYGPEMTAQYCDPNGVVNFTLAAVFNQADRKFSFHS
jgi:hypothetical protein